MGDLGALLSSIFTGGIGLSQLIGGGAGSVSGSAAAGASAANPFGGQFANYQPQLQTGLNRIDSLQSNAAGGFQSIIDSLAGIRSNATQTGLQNIFNNPLTVGSNLTSSPENLFQNAIAAGNSFAQGPQAQQQLQYNLGNVNRTLAASGTLGSGQQQQELYNYGNQFTTQAFQQGFQNFLGANQQAYGQNLTNLQTQAALQQQQFGQGAALQQMLQGQLTAEGGLVSNLFSQLFGSQQAKNQQLLTAAGATTGSPATAGGILSGQFANNQQALANLASGIAGAAGQGGGGGFNNVGNMIRNIYDMFGGAGGAASSLGSLGGLFGGGGIFGGSAGTIGGVGDTLGSILGSGSYLPGISMGDLGFAGGSAYDIGGAALGFSEGSGASAAGAGAAEAAGAAASSGAGAAGASAVTPAVGIGAALAPIAFGFLMDSLFPGGETPTESFNREINNPASVFRNSDFANPVGPWADLFGHSTDASQMQAQINQLQNYYNTTNPSQAVLDPFYGPSANISMSQVTGGQADPRLAQQAEISMMTYYMNNPDLWNQTVNPDYQPRR